MSEKDVWLVCASIMAVAGWFGYLAQLFLYKKLQELCREIWIDAYPDRPWPLDKK